MKLDLYILLQTLYEQTTSGIEAWSLDKSEKYGGKAFKEC